MWHCFEQNGVWLRQEVLISLQICATSSFSLRSVSTATKSFSHDQTLCKLKVTTEATWMIFRPLRLSTAVCILHRPQSWLPFKVPHVKQVSFLFFPGLIPQQRWRRQRLDGRRSVAGASLTGAADWSSLDMPSLFLGLLLHILEAGWSLRRT